MSFNSFVFSEKRSDRIKRHLVFWVIWWVYFAISHAANPFGKPEISYFRNPVFTLTESGLLVLLQIPITYVMLYFILPRFILKKKYVLAFVGIALIWFLGAMMHLFAIIDLFPKILSLILPDQYLVNTKRPEGVSVFMAVMANNKGTFTITAFAFVIKFGKHWYMKEQRNLQLQKQNTEAQLQLLTAQVHPHFLFNTLNNIYSQAQNESPKSSKMIMGLSELLRHIIYEGRKPLVPLDRELQITLEYIHLEKIRYGNKLDLHYLLPDKTTGIYIAPLLLLPFVENCFKHGASNMLENPWISLTIELKTTTLVMKLMNGKANVNGVVPKKPGIGISNVRQRLELLYKDKHSLQISEDEEVFIVDLKIELVKMGEPQHTINQPAPQILHA